MIQSAYNFVPLNKYVYIPNWWNQVSNDIPFSDGEDGYIEFIFENVSPLFTRNGSKSKNEKYSAHVLMNDGKKLYFLPGTSIKGMLRSTLEVLAFAKMAQFNDRSFGFRTFNEQENDYESYHSTIKDQKCGWLQKVGDDYSLIPCDGDFETIDIAEIRRMFGSRFDTNGIGARNKAIGPYPIITLHRQQYKVVCTGKMENRKEPEKSKKHEYLFPVGTLEPISLMERVGEKTEKKKVLKQFLSVYAQNKDATDFIADYLEKGKKIHVFYVLNEQGNIAAMGLSKMMKLPYSNSIQDLISNRQKKVEGRDLCETIFGYISDDDNEKSLKGRVMVSNAFCVDKNGKNLAIDDNELLKKSGVLGEPKPSFYPFYVEQDRSSGCYKTYEGADTIAGRKIYRIHQGAGVTSLHQGNGNVKVTTSFWAIPVGHSFKCRIYLHNMRPAETGAVLYALTLENGSYHNIGMAKAFGYGKLECHDIRLSLRKTVEEYIAIFKKVISSWGENVLCKEDWDYGKRIEVATLMAIRSEHTDKEVEMPDMKHETGEFKPNGKPVTENQFEIVKRNFQTLKENIDNVILQSDEEEERQARFAEQREETLKQKEAERLARNKAKNEWKQKQKEENEKVITNADPSSVTDIVLSFTEQLALAPSVGQLTKMIEKHYKDNGKNNLSDEELHALTKGILNVISSLKEKMSRKDLIQKGAWSPDGSIWKKVVDLVGCEPFVSAFPVFDDDKQ